MSGGPNSYIIFPDLSLTGSRNIVSIEPVAAGEYVGAVVSENDNRGSLVSTMQGKYIDPSWGTLTDDDKRFDFRVQVGGGNKGGTWAHKPSKIRNRGTVISDMVGAEQSIGDLLVVNGVTTPLSVLKDTWTPPPALPATSALAKAISINQNTEVHGVTAAGLGAVIVFDTPILGGVLNANDLIINGYDLLLGGLVVYLPNDSSSTLRNAINANTSFHGIEASLVSVASGILQLTAAAAEDFGTGANLLLEILPLPATDLGWSGATTTINRAGITLTSDTHIDLQDSEDVGGVLGFDSVIIFRSQILGGLIFGTYLVVNNFDLVGPGPFAFTVNDGTSALRNAINARTSIHGITADLDGTTRLRLTAVAGTLRLYVNPAIAGPLGWTGEQNTVHLGLDGEASSKQYYGYNEERYVHFAHGGMLQVGGDSACGAFIPRYNREIVYSADDTIGNVAKINCAYRNIDDESSAWTQTTISFIQENFYGIGYTAAIFTVCSMRDGTLRMMSRTSRNDINIWSSNDGLKWKLLSSDVASKYLQVFPTNLFQPTMDSSGDYLRLAWIDLDSDGTTDYLRCIVSADGGASWSEPVMNFTPLIIENGDLIDQHVYTMAGLKDESGTFLLHWMLQGVIRIETAIAVGTQAFVDSSSGFALGNPSAQDKMHMTAVRGQDDYWIMIDYFTQPTISFIEWHRTGHEFVLIRIDPSNPLPVSGWSTNNFLTGAQGTQRWIPCFPTLINCEKYLSFFAGVVDADVQANLFAQDTKSIYFRMGGWDMAPIANYTIYRPESSFPSGPRAYQEFTPNPLPIVGWHVPFGTVAPLGGGNVASTSPWTRTVLNTTSNYNSSRQRLTDTPLVGDFWINELDDLTWSTTPPSDAQPPWMPTTDAPGGVVVEAMVKTEFGYTTIIDSYDAAIFFDINASDHTTGLKQSVYLRVVIASDGIALRDINLGTGILENSLILTDMTKWARIRLVISTVNIGTYLVPSLQTQAMLCLSPQGGYNESASTEWIRRGPFAVTETSVGSIVQKLRFGQLANNPLLGPAPTIRRSSWRSINIFNSEEEGISGVDVRNTALTQFRAYGVDDDWPQHLRGRQLSSNPIQMGYGISARWGGAAGFSGDYFNGATKYQYGAENILLPSPRLQYRSRTDKLRTSADTFKVVLVADPDNPMVNFTWNSIACFNSNIGNVFIRVSQDNATWTDLTPLTPVESYLTIVTAPDIIEVYTPNKILVRLSGGLGYVPNDAEWNTSEGKQFAADIHGTFDGVPFFRSVKINECIRISDSIYELILDVDFDILLIDIQVVVVTSGRWVFNQDTVRNDRYIEITGSTAVSGATDYSLGLGTLVVGVREQLTVPLEWTLQDNEQPNITNFKTKGGLAWAYPEGPPQRTFSGRIVGDVSQEERDTLRQLLRSHSGYELRPVVLVLDDSLPVQYRINPHSNPNNVILGRITSGSQLDNAAWYQQQKQNAPSDNIVTWNQAGDMAITFEEEV